MFFTLRVGDCIARDSVGNLFDYANFAKYTAVELELYKTKEKMKYDYQNTLDYAEKKGRADGRSEEKLENARSLKERGVSLEIISEALGLPIETVREL